MSSTLEIRKTIAQYPHRSSALLPTLHITQRKHGGWLPGDSMENIADRLELSSAHVQGVVTFHSMFYDMPVARNLIQLCTNVSCMLFGSETLLDVIKERYSLEPGGTAPDKRFSLMVMECIGLCDQAPAMLVNRNVHSGLDPETIINILETYR
jgi:NADH-quinone oxidoreductase E subunit